MKNPTTLLALTTAASLTALTLSTSAPASAAPGGGATIVETAVGAGRFDTLVAALQATGLDAVLAGPGPFTVFAPTDAAFADLPPGTVDFLLQPENQGLLTAILTYHVVPGTVPAAQAVTLDFAGTVNGQRIGLEVNGGNLFIDDAQVIVPDIFASNGVIHVIDSVLSPETRDLIEVAMQTGRFNTLQAALEAAALITTLQGDGPFTVFAPTDHAFEALPPGTVEMLLMPENQAQLTTVLLNHVADGRLYSDDLLTAGSFSTLLNVQVPVQVTSNGVEIGNTLLVNSDFDTANGVVHVIDRVLMP